MELEILNTNACFIYVFIYAWPPRTRIDVELGLRLQTSRKITTRKTVRFQLTFF